MSILKRGAALFLFLLLAGLIISGNRYPADTEAKTVRKITKIKLVSPASGAKVTNSNAVLQKWWTHYKKHKAYKTSKKKAKYGTRPITLRWKRTSKKRVTYKVFLSRSASFKHVKTYRVKENYLKLRNLHCNARYYWKVSQGKAVSGARWFRTRNMARVLRVKGVKNARDIGGYTTRDGKIVRQGLVFRSGELDKITKSGKKTVRKRMKIRTELDLRAPGEGNVGKNTGLAKKYLNLPGYAYYKIWEKPDGGERIVREMKVFADRDNYPILIHCIYGRDRTGTLALILNGLLGVRKQDLYRDYELTFFAQVPDRKYKKRIREFDQTYRYLRTYKDKEKSLSYNIEAFLLDNGMTRKEISIIKEIMLVSSSFPSET